MPKELTKADTVAMCAYHKDAWISVRQLRWLYYHTRPIILTSARHITPSYQLIDLFMHQTEDEGTLGVPLVSPTVSAAITSFESDHILYMTDQFSRRSLVQSAALPLTTPDESERNHLTLILGGSPANDFEQLNEACVGLAPQRIYVTMMPCNECAKLLIQVSTRTCKRQPHSLKYGDTIGLS